MKEFQDIVKGFEYKVTSTKIYLNDITLNNLGKEGWELVNILYSQSDYHFRSQKFYYFKRERTILC